jgi:acid phosphatase type 7
VASLPDPTGARRPRRARPCGGPGLVLLLAALLGGAGACAEREAPLGGDALIPRGAAWRFTSHPSQAGPGWEQPEFDDAGWERGRAPLGHGKQVRTRLPRRPEGSSVAATWYRHAFGVADAAGVEGLGIELLRDAGAVVYLNGREVLRNNLPGGELSAEKPAGKAVWRDDKERRLRLGLPGDLLREGENVLAVAVHQQRPGSSALRFDLALAAYTEAHPLAVIRGPYLQRMTPIGVTVRFATNRPTRGRVRFGSKPHAMNEVAFAAAASREHEVVLEGLAPGTRYHYAVGTLEGDFERGRDSHFFTTAPPRGTPAATRIWVTGDPGTGNVHARAVRDAFARHSGVRGADVWLTLGDNAYPSGTPSEFQDTFFDTFRDVLRRTPVWPALGNHDLYADAPLTGRPAYFDLFTLPAAGEAGGLPSGSPHYYAFEHGNIRFVALDSVASDRAPEGPMLSWLRENLALVETDWLIAYLHHAPFSRGTHHGQQEQSAAAVRAHMLPLLEAAGADLVLAGHNHNYERSTLLYGPHPGTWAFEEARIVSRASGRRDEGGPYRKGEGHPPGTVYVVAGSAGQTGPGALDHPAMHVSLAVHGSLVIDVEGCELDAVFVDEEGEILDRFAISKGPPCGGSRTPG